MYFLIYSIFDTLNSIKALNTFNWEKTHEEIENTFKENFNIVSSSCLKNKGSLIYKLKNEENEFEIIFKALAGKLPLPRTEFKFFKTFDLKLNLTPEKGFLVKILKLLWLKDQDIGIKEFDQKFIIKTNNLESAKLFLNENLRYELINIINDKTITHSHMQLRENHFFTENHGIISTNHIQYYINLVKILTTN